MATSASLVAEDQGAVKHLFSCASCYQKKKKCDRNKPCLQCLRKDIKCTPSPIETTERPRKRRFPEAELLDQISRYEAALLSYGADLEAILNSNEPAASKRKSIKVDLGKSSTAPEDVTASFLAIVDGGESPSDNNTQNSRSWYDDFFAHDNSSLLFAVDPVEVPAHPAPFDIFKLWQVYCYNVHPINKLLHAPSFQRKISSYGSLLNLAPAADQALFFAVYTAATTTLSAEQCMEIFSTSKEVMLDQFKLATQVWLRRASVWRTSDLTVLQAFVLFLSSIQNVVDPRVLSCFTGVADRIARRMGLHRDLAMQPGSKPLDREMRTRVWWEIVLLDAKAVERSGLGTSTSTGHWNARLPSPRSDSDLESMGGVLSLAALSSPSSEMIPFLIRAEVALFVAELHNERAGTRSNHTDNSTLTKRLESIDTFERRLQTQYLCFCDTAHPSQRLALIFAQASLSRIRISAYIVEDSSKASIGLELLKYCTSNLESYSQMRNDVLLQPFKWFILQSLPVFAYINMLRLLQEYVSGEEVQRAWQALAMFKGAGPRQVADALTLKAWKARKRALPHNIDDPAFITEIYSRGQVAALSASTDSSSTLSESDMMALMAEILSSEVYCDIDWSC